MGFQRKNGAARTTARAALRLVVGARHLRSHTIATMVLPTGWPDGLWPRRHGAARTRARAALQPLEVALETTISACDEDFDALAHGPSSGALTSPQEFRHMVGRPKEFRA